MTAYGISAGGGAFDLDSGSYATALERQSVSERDETQWQTERGLINSLHLQRRHSPRRTVGVADSPVLFSVFTNTLQFVNTEYRNAA